MNWWRRRVEVAIVKARSVEHRDEALAGLAGRVVEVGAGTGANFAHYPAAVTEVVGVEPEPYLREIAERAASAASVPVRVLDGVADRLPLDDASCDAGVASLVLCTVDDPAAALGELRRVIRPGGELRFFEHVRAESPGFARFQRVVDVVWPHLGGGVPHGPGHAGVHRGGGVRGGAGASLQLPSVAHGGPGLAARHRGCPPPVTTPSTPTIFS